MAVFTFDAVVAYSPAADAFLPGVLGSVYLDTDTLFTTPLTVTAQGASASPFLASRSTSGLIPTFTLDQAANGLTGTQGTRVVWKSGSYPGIPLTSMPYVLDELGTRATLGTDQTITGVKTMTAPRFKGGPFFDAKAYGALGNGVANDQPGIGAAHGALPSTGGTVFLPPGVFKMSTRLIVSKPGVTIRGAGPDATVLLIDQAAFQVGASDVLVRDLTIKGSNGVLTRLALQAIATGGQWRNWRFENVKFDGVGIAVTRIGATDTNGNAVTTGSDLAEHVEFDRCEFTAYTPDGFLWVQGTHHVSVDRCWFHDSGTSTAAGDQFKASYGARYWRVSGSTFERSTRDAIDCYDASRGIVENNTIVDPGVHGIDTKFVNAAAANATDRLIIRGNRVVNAGTATASPAMQLSVDGVLAEGNMIEGGSGAGLRCGSSTDGSVRSKDATWTGNRVIGTASYGFYLAGCDGAIVTQNTATDCLNSGFHIASATNSAVVVGHNRSARNSAADVVGF